MWVSEEKALQTERTVDAKDPWRKQAQKKEKEASVMDDVDQEKDEIRR